MPVQQAISLAEQQGEPLIVDGNIHCPVTTPLVFGTVSVMDYEFRNLYLGPITGNQPAVTRGTHYGTHLRWTGAIDYRGTAPEAWLEQPVELAPDGVQPAPVTEGGETQVPTIWIRGGSASYVFTLDPSKASIANESFIFDKLNGGCIAEYGINIESPTPATGMGQVHFRFNVIAATTIVGIDEGHGGALPMAL